MKRIIQFSPEFMSAVLQIRRDKFRPRLKLLFIIFVVLFLFRLLFEAPLNALLTSCFWTFVIGQFLFITYPKRAFWFPQEALAKKVFKGSRALVSCLNCTANQKKIAWYPEQSVLTKFKLTKKSSSTFEKRKITTYETIDHYSSNGDYDGYSKIPKKEKYYAETWTEDWEFEYQCPKCREVTELKVRDYMDNGWCVDFEIITKRKRS